MKDNNMITQISSGKIIKYKKENSDFFESAYLKNINYDNVFVNENGIIDDEQADRRWHGGIDKAVMFFSEKHENGFGKIVFGANIFINNLSEHEVMIGDIYKIGSAEVGISQPRQPCWKVSFFGGNDVLKYLVSSGYSGFYGKIIKSGQIAVNDQINLITRVSDLSVFEATALLKGDKTKLERMKQVLNITALADSYKIDLKKQINKLYN